ncbi:MAG: HEAT repeat domain-containing protein [Nitrospirae bacterium]|nr:HEAT repeat domain-containing protein [Nitrospirota bacterium]
MRSFVSAIRAVKLYPPNNPVYSQSVKKSFESLNLALARKPEFTIGIQKTFFTYERMPSGKEPQINQAIAQDLFAKGLREIIFNRGVSEKELLDLCQALALSNEEMAMKSGISSILWEKGATNITVTEAGLDDVITTRAETAPDIDVVKRPEAEGEGASKPKKDITALARTLVLGDLFSDPEGYGADMVEFARQTVGAHETVEDRLFSLYKEAGRQIGERSGDEHEALFEGLAKSVLSIDAPMRTSLIAGKMYADLDANMVAEQGLELPKELPGELHEIVTGRYPREWTVQQVTTLLKRLSQNMPEPLKPPSAPEKVPAVPLREDIYMIAKEMSEYTAEELEDLKLISDSGMESDIIEAAVRTLIFLMTLVKDDALRKTVGKEVHLFSGVVHQIEEMLSYLLKKKDYDLASLIIRALHMPVAAEFKPRLIEAIRKTTSPKVIGGMINELRNSAKGSTEYNSAYAYLAMMERESTEVMLDLLAEEKDRVFRLFLVDLLMDLGKNQTALIAEKLSDDRWYVVRNAVRILSEYKNERTVSFLLRVLDHKNLQVRQEVAKGLILIGGKKATTLLVRYLQDKHADMQFMALRGLGEISGAGATEAQNVVDFLQNRRLTGKENELTIEGIRVLGKIGDRGTAEFLKRYTKLRWWRSRRLQSGLRAEALTSIEEIEKRRRDGGRTTGR